MNEELKTMASLSDGKQEPVALAAGRCLSNDDILGFVQGYLQEQRLESLHAHVDACEVCQRLVSEAAHALDAEPISESTRPSWNTVFHAGTLVDKRYSILRLIARGGMGEVYEAHDTALHERVALKTVTSTACDSAQAVRYLKAEVQLARRISHPNVCRIYDFGTHEMGPAGGEIHFLVMEFVEGQCLGKRLRHFGALPLELAQSIAEQLLLGLRAAHLAGILHRDFKSDNVMLRSESGGRVTPVILDFGLAKALNESGNMATTQNQSHGMVGTIGYMAPEQIEGEPLSKASDVYAFGVVWFEMLTGRLPFEGDTPVAAAMARLHRPPVAPSTLNAEVPKWLDDIVLRCLSRHRTGRFSSAEQVLEAIANQPGTSSGSTNAPVASAPIASDAGATISSRGQLGFRWLGHRWPLTALAAVLGIAATTLSMQRHQELPRVEPWEVKPLAAPQAQIPPLAPQIQVLPVPPRQTPELPPAANATTNASHSSIVEATPRTARAKTRMTKSSEPKTPSEREDLARKPPIDGSSSTAGVATESARPSTDSVPSPAKGKMPDWLPIWTNKKGNSGSQAVAR